MAQGQPDFVALANSYGIKGVNIENESQLHAALYEYRHYPYPVLFDILIIENENCYPMVSPGKTNAVMTGVNYQQEELDLVERLSTNEDRMTIELEAKAKADEEEQKGKNEETNSELETDS